MKQKKINQDILDFGFWIYDFISVKHIVNRKSKIVNLLSFGFCLFSVAVNAQQIKRATLSSTGKISTFPLYRITSTAGSCPGCSVLHPASPATAGYLRQGFQQPPRLSDTIVCNTVANFAATATPTNCGLRFDFEYTGTTATDFIFNWNFGTDAFPQKSSAVNPGSIYYTSSGLKVVNLTVTKGDCVSSASTILSLSSGQLGLGIKPTVSNIKCFGDASGNITVTTVGGKSPFTYLWSNGSSGNVLLNVVAARYQLTVTDGNNCKISLDTAVSQPSLPLTITATKIDETCAGFKDGSVSVNVSGGTKPFSYKWSTGSIKYIADTLIPSKYTLTVKDIFGCKLDTAFNIIDRCKKSLTTYDIITPNGDGINDTWFFPHIEDYPNNQLFIYNRWGQLIYSKTGYLSDWAGTNTDGQPLLTGAYFYVMKLNDNKQTVFNGSITIVR